MDHDGRGSRLLAERTEVADLLAGTESSGERGPGRGGSRTPRFTTLTPRSP